MSAQSTIYNPSSTTSAATGDGFSCPRVSTGGRLAIPFGANDKGMMVYDVTLNSLFVWNGSAWELIDGTGTSSNTQVLFNDNGTPAGDTTMTFDKTTETLTIQNLVVTGTTTALGGLDASAIRAAASDYAAVAFDGGTASTRITSACQALGTGDFSMWSRFRVPTSIVGGNAGVFFISDTDGNSTRPNAFLVYITTGNALQIQRYGATTSDLRLATIASFRSTYSGQVVDLVITRSGATLKVYINGTDTAYSESTGGTPPAWSDTVVSSFFNVGCLSSAATTIFPGRIYRSVVYNRALSASDVTELITLGVNPADQWGTQTAAYTSNFSAGEDGWSGVRGISNGNIDGISGVDNTLRFTVDGTASNTHYEANIAVPGLLISKRYRVGFNYFITAANATMNGLRLAQLTTSNFLTPVQSVTGAWTSTTPVEFVATETRLDVLGYAGAVNIFNGNGTDTFYLHSIVLTRIGAIVDLDFTIGTGYQATDRSTNRLNGTLFNAVSWTMPQNSAILYATTAFAGDSQMLGTTLSIPTNAIIEDIIVNSPGAATVTVRDDAPGGTVIVNAAAVVAGRQKLTIAVPFSTTGKLWVNSSNASALQFTVVYNIAS